MGSRLEYILLLIAISIALIPLLFNYEQKTVQKKVDTPTKNSEIRNFTQYDINATSVLYTLKSKFAEEIGDLWYIKEPIVANVDIKSLSSQKAIANKSSKIEFIGDVKLYKKDGKSYFSQKAIYDTKNKTIITPDKFLISKEYDMVRGENLVYDTSTKTTKAKRVKGVFRLNNSPKN